jgi:hypothetical protein
MAVNVGDSRRKFILNGFKAAGILATANVGVYAIGSAFKELDGSMVAGAKTWTIDFQTGSGNLSCSVLLLCPLTDGPCTMPVAPKIKFHCGCEGNGPGNEFSNAQYSCQ